MVINAECFLNKLKPGKAPFFSTYLTQSKEVEKAFRTKLGAAWQNEDESINLKFIFIPTYLNIGIIQLREKNGNNINYLNNYHKGLYL